MIIEIYWSGWPMAWLCNVPKVVRYTLSQLVTDSPENCQFNVKNCPKLDTFSKTLPKIVLFFQKNCQLKKMTILAKKILIVKFLAIFLKFKYQFSVWSGPNNHNTWRRHFVSQTIYPGFMLFGHQGCQFLVQKGSD